MHTFRLNPMTYFFHPSELPDISFLFKWNLIIQAGRVEKKQTPLAKVVSVAGRSRISVAPSPVWALNQPRGENRCKPPRNSCDMEKSLVLWLIPSEHTKPIECGEGDLQIEMWLSFWFQPTKLMTYDPCQSTNTLNVPLPTIRDVNALLCQERKWILSPYSWEGYFPGAPWTTINWSYLWSPTSKWSRFRRVRMNVVGIWASILFGHPLFNPNSQD